MSAAPTIPDSKPIKMTGVEMFAKGIWRGKPYKESDLKDIITNFENHQSPGPNRAMRVAMVKYHWPEEIHESRIPKHGTVTRVYRENGKLLYDAENVDPVLAQEIKDGKFEDISAEIYDNPPEGIKGASGKMLRRITFQGAEPPHIKGLNPRGLARTLHFSEVPKIQITRISNRSGTYEAFSETVPVSRDEMIARLGEMGMTPDVLNTLDDVQLQEIVKTAMGQGSSTLESTPGKGAPPGDKTVPDQPKPGMKPGETEPDGDENVGDDKEVAAKKYTEMKAKCDKYAEAYKSKFGAMPASVGADGGAMSSTPSIGFTEGQIETALASVIEKGNSRVAEMFSEARTKIDAEVAANQKQLADSRVELKRQRLELFTEKELITGRLEPADLDRGADGKAPNCIDRWMLLDDSAVVHKFSEGGKDVAWTTLDAELNAVKRRPVKYTKPGEKIASDMPKHVETFAEGSKEGRKARFVSFAESQAERFRISDTTPKEIIDAWETAPTEAARRELERDLGFAAA